jgi:Effector Associated Constant Component 1
MGEERFCLRVEGGDAFAARSLADDLREREGVLAARRSREGDTTMDLGAIVTVIASSGATLVIAQGIADWLRRRRSTRLVIERDPTSGSLKAVVENIDPAAAMRITEILRGG